MNHHALSHAGRHLLNRRDFLRWGGLRLGGIAHRLTDGHGHVNRDALA